MLAEPYDEPETLPPHVEAAREFVQADILSRETGNWLKATQARAKLYRALQSYYEGQANE